ncbi:RsiW-degrading membrane proteinase PrsW (M82 family) [Rudaeicoccus suwonensis]|uniref:RsiW-degrading membrane proteinase PrsW (M82 family) n=1 Tax=Rudaeicoccus suwonensis TaxID=657409 RepID=A0A561DWT2_9MICO|nr:RsiW-degrading membrane proteinase PrsW (M82 family) [Rudaeicoccus suwonensis]
MSSVEPAPSGSHRGRGVLLVPRADRRPVLRKWLFIALGIVFFGCGGVAMLLITGSRSGVTATVFGFVLSLVVVGIVVPVFLWLDRFEREPTWMLICAFAWGACIATLGAVVLNDVGSYLFDPTHTQNTGAAVFVAPVVEESMKALGPLLLLLWRRREVDGIVDGMVYAGLSAAGFAAVEDIVYLAGGYADSGDRGLFSTFLVRVVMSPFAHPMFTICTGIGIGVAVTTARWWLRIGAPVVGWSAAVGLHFLWNVGAVLSQRGWLIFYIALQLPLFVGFMTLIVLARRHEGRMIGIHLGTYVDRGLLTPQEVQMLASVRERRYAEAWAERHGGKQAQREMREFQEAGSELAMIQARLHRGQHDRRTVQTELQLLALVGERRTQFLDTALYRYYVDRAEQAGR